MATSYILYPCPVWTALNLLGQPNVSGTITFYDANNPTELKPVYKDSQGVVEWDNPIDINVTGAQDENYPIYFADDSPYRIEIRNSAGALIHEYDPFPDGNQNTPVIPDQEISNMIENGQFGYPYQTNYATVPTSIDPLLPLNWSFAKNNTSATDTITFPAFNLGQVDVDAFPKYYFNYTCTGAGSSETQKDLIKKWSGVDSFSNTQMTLAITATSSANSSIEILFIQYFGSGGSPSSTVISSISTQQLSSDWQTYEFTFTPPTVNGKVLGINGDDYCAIAIRMPLNTTSNVALVNIGEYFGDQAPDYQFQSPDKTKSLVIADQFPLLSDVNIDDGCYIPVLIKGNRRFSFQSWAGVIVELGFAYASGMPWLYCDNSPTYSQDTYNLNNEIGISWGTGPDGFTTSVATNTVTATCTTNGAALIAAVDVNTGFTVTQTVAGSGGTQAVCTIQTTAASINLDGKYLFISSGTQNYCVYLSLNNRTPSPSAVTNRKFIKVIFTGTETNAQLATLIGTQIQYAQVRLPDKRGLFGRGRDNTANRDPDKAGRTALATGGATGNNVGSYQEDALEDHYHQTGVGNAGGGGANIFGDTPDQDGFLNTNSPQGARVSTETRPKNVYVDYAVFY